MPPSTISIIPPPSPRKDRRRHRSADHEEASSSANADPVMAPAGPNLAGVFKKDLTNIKSLVTCSICDQLLYEPWTLACGHTYCYSCLNSWFVPNPRKKTCPECRSKVTQQPAPNFLVKQMVEIFTKRVELMPADESIEQHNTKRAEEIADVEKDRKDPNGLFKGIFSQTNHQLMRDEEDGVLRCPHCGWEHEEGGGPECEHCGLMVDDSDFSDVDDEMPPGYPGLQDGDAFAGDRLFPHLHQGRHHHHHRHHLNGDLEDFTSESSSGSDEDDTSLQDFVVQDEGSSGLGRNPGRLALNPGRFTDEDEDEDESPPRRPAPRNREVIAILSDSDSDEGGQIIDRRSRRRNIAPNSSPSALTVSSTNGSEAGDMHSEADRLRTAGWSPLDHGTDSDQDPDAPEGYGYGSTLDGNESEEDSDTNTETMVGNAPSDDGERDDMSDTPTYDSPYHQEFSRYRPEVYEHVGGDDDSDVDSPGLRMDGDGDTEMSVSPDARRRETSVSTNPYRNDSEPRSSRQSSVLSGYGYGQDGRGQSVNTTDANGYNNRYENLGQVNRVLEEEEEDSSDAEIRPPARRRRPRYNLNPRVQQYDPRISMLFADHQQVQEGRSGSREHPVDLEEMEIELVEPASSGRRRTVYGRRQDLLGSSRSPSVSRVVVASGRGLRSRRAARERSYNN